MRANGRKPGADAPNACAKAFLALADGFYKHLQNSSPSSNSPKTESLQLIHQAAMLTLLRLLFIRIAGSRKLLSLPDRWLEGNFPALPLRLFSPELDSRLAGLELEEEHLREALDLLAMNESSEFDLGAVFESLLECQLVAVKSNKGTSLQLADLNTIRKAGGVYFTPTELTVHLVRQALSPLLSGCGNDAEKVLALRILDPAMGAGSFLIQAVEEISDYLQQHCSEARAGNENWRSLVLERCIHGVDCNPLTAALAEASLWLHCSTAEHAPCLPLCGIKCGDSLLGVTPDRLHSPGLTLKQGSKLTSWQVAPAGSDPACPETGPEGPGREACRLLADLWCAQWFFVPPEPKAAKRYFALYRRVKAICNMPEEEIEAALGTVDSEPLIQRIKAARSAIGSRDPRFFHWPLEFQLTRSEGDNGADRIFGFDAVIGNPPWEKLKPARRDFYTPLSILEGGKRQVTNLQARSLQTLIDSLHRDDPQLEGKWKDYERDLKDRVRFLRQSAVYTKQHARIAGRKVGGDSDLYRFFIERALQLVRPGGAVGYLIPATFWQSESGTALRRHLFEKTRIHELYTFENHRKWAFPIDPRFKFSALVLTREAPPTEHRIKAAFRLRSASPSDGWFKKRLLALSPARLTKISADYFLLEVKAKEELELIENLHDKHPELAASAGGWEPRFRRELDMTNDAALFKSAAWMGKHGFTKQGPDLVNGGIIWQSPAQSSSQFPPNARYTALYEGRMIHNFDHCQKAYVEGEGRRAIWNPLPFSNKRLESRVYVCPAETSRAPDSARPRIGFVNATSASNERTILAALIGPDNLAGNGVPTLSFPDIERALCFTALFNSFCCDWLARLRVSNNLNWTFVRKIPLPSFTAIDNRLRRELMEKTARLSCTTPELKEIWKAVFPNTRWSPSSAAIEPRERAELRAKIDAIAAELYGLSVPQYARILLNFPLLDRGQPALPGDRFLTEARKTRRKATSLIENTEGRFEAKARSFITRDKALLAYIKRRQYSVPIDLNKWFKEEVGFDPEGASSRFRIGEIRGLAERVKKEDEIGAVAYLV